MKNWVHMEKIPLQYWPNGKEEIISKYLDIPFHVHIFPLLCIVIFKCKNNEDMKSKKKNLKRKN